MNKKEIVIITKEKFNTYTAIQHSGMTNMFDVKRVISLSHHTLNKEDCLDIMKNYSEYKKEYNQAIDFALGKIAREQK